MLKKSKVNNLLVLLVMLFVGLACSRFMSGSVNEPKKELVNLPSNLKVEDYDVDFNLDKETAMILTITADGKFYQEQNKVLGEGDRQQVERKEIPVTKEELPAKLKKFSETTDPYNQIVYFKADVSADFDNVLQIFNLVRDNEIDKVGLVVAGKRSENNPSIIRPMRFEVKLPAKPDKISEPLKPNPLTLVASLETDGRVKLNVEDMEFINDTTKLENKLIEIFKHRESEGVFRESTGVGEKTVFVKASKSTKYGDFMKLVNAVRIGGGFPIGIQIDDNKFFKIK